MEWYFGQNNGEFILPDNKNVKSAALYLDIDNFYRTCITCKTNMVQLLG